MIRYKWDFANLYDYYQGKPSSIFLSFMLVTLGWSTWTTNSLIDISKMYKIKCYSPIQSVCSTFINLAYITTNMEPHVCKDAHRQWRKGRLCLDPKAQHRHWVKSCIPYSKQPQIFKALHSKKVIWKMKEWALPLLTLFVKDTKLNSRDWKLIISSSTIWTSCIRMTSWTLLLALENLQTLRDECFTSQERLGYPVAQRT